MPKNGHSFSESSLYPNAPCLTSNPCLRTLESKITNMPYVNLFTPLPLLCFAITEDRKFCVVITVVWSPEKLTLQKFCLGLVAKFCFRVYSDEA
jgi:hypothetical protein